MRAIVCVALALLLAASASRSARAVEPDAPQALITRAEAIRIAVQASLSEKFTTTTNSKKAEQGALVEYYAVADQPTLWVDEHGLTERGKAVIAEIEQADDYGLRASDYPLPNLAEFTGSGPSATQWLADAELKISYAVLGYARDARGGRMNPSRLSPNLDPDLVLPNPSEVIEFDRHSLGSSRISAELPAGSAAIRGAQAEAHRAPRRQDRGFVTAGRHHSGRAAAQARRRA